MFSVLALILLASVSDVFTDDIPTVLVLTFDGFKPGYTQENKTPYINSLIEHSAGVESVRSTFPTQTKVTTFTIATGVNIDVHGLYGNDMFDKDYNVMSNTQEQFQTNPELVPIWIENQNAGNDRHSGCMMWPGSQFEYQGKKPKYFQAYDTNIDWTERVNTIVDWMTKPTERANLVMAYFEDTPIYDGSIYDAEIEKFTKKVDDTVRDIHNKLKASSLNDNFYMVVMSDHGTKKIIYDNIIDLKDIYTFDESDKILSLGPAVFIKPNKDKYDDVVKAFQHHALGGPAYVLYEYKNFNSHWYLQIDKLKECFLVVGQVGFTFKDKEALRSIVDKVGESNFVMNENGYDDGDNDMYSHFMILGPKIIKNTFIPDYFRAIEIYRILKHALDLKDKASKFQEDYQLNTTVGIMFNDYVAPKDDTTTMDKRNQEEKINAEKKD